MNGHTMPITALVITIAATMAVADQTPLSRTVTPMDNTRAMTWQSGSPRVVEDGPGGQRALQFGTGDRGGADAKLSGSLDLTARGLDPKAYDLLKIDVKADRAAVLLVTLINYPTPGQQTNWWVLDGLRGPFDWRTIWIDLRVPEEFRSRAAPAARRTVDAEHVVLNLQGSIKDTGRRAQGTDRRIWLGPVRLARKAIDLDWDQSKAPYTWGKDKDLVFTYPLTVTNRLDRPVTARLSLRPFEVRGARAELADDTVPLAAGQTKTVTARIVLPAEAAAAAEPLYCERFEALGQAVGVPDSQVTILRSSDPIHLSVTVPLPDRRLKHPILPRPSKLPADIVRFDPAVAKKQTEAGAPAALIADAKARALGGGAAPFNTALIAAAYLYDYTGQPQYLQLAERLIAGLPDIWAHHYAQWRGRPIRLISHGVVAGNTLRLGWRVGGTQRSPYQWSRDANARHGGMCSIAYAFDLVAARLDPAVRRRAIEGFFLPAAIHSRNHYVGDGNQQATANVTTLWGGLLGRNWPLVSFAYSSEHGIDGILTWCFDDAGVHLRKKYQTYSMRPILWTAELLHALEMDFYPPRAKRLGAIVNARPPVGAAFQDGYFWEFVTTHRLKP